MRAAVTALGRARLVAGTVVGAYLLLLVALGGWTRWGRLGVPQMPEARGPRPFEDMRDVTSAWECTARGVRVLPANPCDPWGRAFDFPRAWLLPSHLGVGQGATVALGLIVAVAFIATVLAIVPRDESAAFGAVVGLALCSPAVMLGIERGNGELIMFVLTVCGLLLLRRGTAGIWLCTGLLSIGAMLKVLPAFALTALARRGRTGLLALGAAALVGLVYVLVTLADVRSVSRVAPQRANQSFGVRRVTDWLAFAYAGRPRPEITGTSARLVDLAVVALAVVAALLLVRWAPLRGPADDSDDASRRRIDLLVGSASIYVCSYAIIRRFDYALVWLLPALPQLWVWARAGRRVAWAALAALVVVLWLDVPWSGTPVGAFLTRWNAATDRLFGSYLSVAVAAQLVLFVALLAALVAGLSAGMRRAAARP